MTGVKLYFNIKNISFQTNCFGFFFVFYLIALNISGMHDQGEKTNFVVFSVK